MSNNAKKSMPALVSAEWLAAELDAPDLRVLDASWYLPADKRDPHSEYAAAHIPGALFFDLDTIADTTSTLPHMLPSADNFAAKMAALGISNDTRVVVYDGHGLMSAARPWWMFRVFGHPQVAVLNGGLPAWRAAGLPLLGSGDEGEKRPAAGKFKANLDTTLLRSLADMRANLDTQVEQVIDARSAGRFRGEDPEPRAGLRGGHIPTSFNVPYPELLNPASRQLLAATDLEKRFTDAGIDLSRPITTTCGSGVSACVLALGLYTLGRSDVAVYDGSWSEWGGNEAVPVETGPAM